MNRLSIHLCSALAAAAVLSVSNVARADEPVPQQLIQVCESCHGPGGAQPILPAYPILAGQHKSYLQHSLREYRSGVREQAVMNAQASALSDEEIDGLAAYFAEQQGPLYVPALR